LKADPATRSRMAFLHLSLAARLPHSVYIPISCFGRHGTLWRETAALAQTMQPSAPRL
jgi:hypothetical protein